MASRAVFSLFKTEIPNNNFYFYSLAKNFHTSRICCQVQAARVKISKNRDVPVTYERSLKPNHIAHRKAWNSWNTSTIEGGLRAAETAIDDVFIRKFMLGTFHGMIATEIVIKRQYNVIRIVMIIFPKLRASKLSFLIGYSEELLGHWLQCPIKIEIQTIKNMSDVIFKYV